MAIDRRPIDQMIQDVGAAAFQRLARLFEDETCGAVTEIRRVFVAGDWRELGRQAHSLKHATASFGLTDLAATAAVLEAAADGRQSAAAEEQVIALESSVGVELTRLAEVLAEIG